MNPVQKAIWFVESHFAQDITLEQIAAIAGVSRPHMVRAFGAATGRSVMRYVRARRLSEAARALANGAPDILALALEAGYSSHEAFTRAFRDQFGITPDGARSARNIELVEPIKMTEASDTVLEPPRFETSRPKLIAGLSARYNDQTLAGIPALWQRFNEHEGNIPDQTSPVAYGICHTPGDDGSFAYVAGVEVSGAGTLPPEFVHLRVPEQKYAVFTHRGHISGIRGTWRASGGCRSGRSWHSRCA